MTNEPSDIAFKDETGQMFMLDKKERILLRELLAKAIKSAGGVGIDGGKLVAYSKNEKPKTQDL
jgi:hypothetical protein